MSTILTSRETALPTPPAGVFSPSFAAASIGMLALISILAFEQLAVATVMPGVAAALNDSSLYAAAFGAAVAAGIVGMVAAGHWCDRAGPATPMTAGAALFVLGLVLAGFAPDMRWLVAGRALQGGGGGLMSVALYVVVGRHYPAALHPRIFAAFAGAWVVPAIVGPALAGLIARHLGWRWVFLAAALLTVPAWLLLQRGLAALPAAPAARDARAPARREIVAAVGAAVSAALLYAGGQSLAWRTLGLGALALAGLALFAPRLLPAGTLRGAPGLPAVVALRGLVAANFFAAEVFLPLLLSTERGLSAVQAGLVLTLGALGWSAGSWWQGREGRARDDAACVHRLRTGLGMMGGGTLVVVLALLPALPDATAVAVTVAGWVIAGTGIGLSFPTLSVLALRFAPAEAQGRASSALQLADSLFSAVGLAFAGALLAALQPQAPRAAFAAGLALAASLSLVGMGLASRARRAH
ncbi:MFS transporter [Aquabacterium humicola]|uniref:MFS transporter n=1 Tax=Aquabacterium humicola TaxID=3237377 RepID=UPI00254342C4|nr:MFS transporter [Rubrivivax pictus]